MTAKASNNSIRLQTRCCGEMFRVLCVRYNNVISTKPESEDRSYLRSQGTATVGTTSLKDENETSSIQVAVTYVNHYFDDNTQTTSGSGHVLTIAVTGGGVACLILIIFVKLIYQRCASRSMSRNKNKSRNNPTAHATDLNRSFLPYNCRDSDLVNNIIEQNQHQLKAELCDFVNNTHRNDVYHHNDIDHDTMALSSMTNESFYGISSAEILHRHTTGNCIYQLSTNIHIEDLSDYKNAFSGVYISHKEPEAIWV